MNDINNSKDLLRRDKKKIRNGFFILLIFGFFLFIFSIIGIIFNKLLPPSIMGIIGISIIWIALRFFRLKSNDTIEQKSNNNVKE